MCPGAQGLMYLYGVYVYYTTAEFSHIERLMNLEYVHKIINPVRAESDHKDKIPLYSDKDEFKSIQQNQIYIGVTRQANGKESFFFPFLHLHSLDHYLPSYVSNPKPLPYQIKILEDEKLIEKQ